MPAFEQVNLAIWLNEVRTVPDAGDQAQAVLGGESPDVLAQRLAQSRLGRSRVSRRTLGRRRGGDRSIRRSDDRVRPRLGRRSARGAHTLRGGSGRPDGARARAHRPRALPRYSANGAIPTPPFTPRVSYGRVTGWTEADGRVVAPFTRVGGLYERARPARRRFALTPTWSTRARLKLDPRHDLQSRQQQRHRRRRFRQPAHRPRRPRRRRRVRRQHALAGRGVSSTIPRSTATRLRVIAAIDRRAVATLGRTRLHAMDGASWLGRALAATNLPDLHALGRPAGRAHRPAAR